MKRFLSLFLALSLLACGASALAQDVPWEGGYLIDANPQSIDLDGDGSQETVYYEIVPDDFESFVRLHVIGADGIDCVYDVEVIASEHAWAGDINRDGSMEIFLWGDVMSDDYYTWCLHYRGGSLFPTLFADTGRGENSDGYYKSGYGMLTDVSEECTITLSGAQDMLGTYFMERTLSLTEAGLFEYADSRWERDMRNIDLDDPEFWDSYPVLTPIAAVPLADGEPLEPGEEFIITGTDKRTEATILTQDGREGTLDISDDYERGWGWLVGGIPEDELFEFVPYAD